MGMVPSKSVGLFVLSMVNGHVGRRCGGSTSRVNMSSGDGGGGAVALSSTVVGLAVTPWERGGAASSAVRRTCKRKVDMPSCGPTSMAMWSDPIEPFALLVVLLGGSVGNEPHEFVATT